MSSVPRKPIRLWPGVIAGAMVLVLRFGLRAIEPDATFYAMVGGLICAVVVVIWWLFFSRAPWVDRIGAIVVMVAAVVVTRPFVDASIRGGMMGMMMPVYSIFVLAPALVAAVVISRGRSDAFRRMAIVAAALVAAGGFTLVRTAGIKGMGSEVAWRWTKTAEERLLALPAEEPKPVAALSPVVEPPKDVTPTNTAAAPSIAPVVIKKDAEWPGFRGPRRDSVVRGVRIDTDWAASPPARLWHRPIGPGWSSFSVAGDLIYTQEQRGSDEIVECYRMKTGELVWRHRDSTRFWESNGGAGPRATPTLDNGRVYAFGATGMLNALDAGTGALVWSRNVAADADKKVPMWGFSSSPLVIGDLVVVAASGKLAAYDIATGKPKWFGPTSLASYSSPHRATIAGVEQILLLTASGAMGVSPSDGSLLWSNAWEEGSTIVQPALTDDGDVLINSITGTGGLGIRRLAITNDSGTWTVTERWTSTGLKPYFNDFVVHKGHAYGFDGSILSCIDLADGKRVWKGGRYGDGQMMLIADQDLLLIVSEDGELALVSATPDQFKEIARVPAIEGKTWNHPVLVGDILLLRNGEEMAAFRLSLAGR